MCTAGTPHSADTVKERNANTREAIAELEACEGTKFATVDDLMADLRADD